MISNISKKVIYLHSLSEDKNFRRDADCKFIKKNVTENKELYYEFNYARENETNVEIWDITFSFASPTESPFEKPWLDDNYYSLMTDIIFTNISLFKCMTFFSKLQLKLKRDSNYQLKMTGIIIQIKDTIHHNYYLSVHQANQIIFQFHEIKSS